MLGILLVVAAYMHTVAAWGSNGHRHVALGMKVLLPHMNTDWVNASLWPDAIKRKPGWYWTGPLHYVNTLDDPPRCCSVQSATKRANILTAITMFYSRLSQHPDDATALSMLVHLVQDVHQPLHVSGRLSGGNDQPIRIGRRTYKLHEVWDSVILEHLYAQHGEKHVLMLTTKCTPAEQCEPEDVARWASESSRLVCSHVYKNINASNDDYITLNAPVVIKRLRQATCRSAALMNRIFNPRICTPTLRLFNYDV